MAGLRQDLEANLVRICTSGSTAAAIGRCHRGAQFIAEPDGRQRPLGIAALEDKILQRAVVEVLNAIYEEDFLGFSYGFRPGRGQHDALDALAVGIGRRKVNWILDADIAGFFDSVSQRMACPFRGAPDRRRARDPLDPQMASRPA